MRWPFACCGLGDSGLFSFPHYRCIPLHSHQRSEVAQSCPPGPLSLAKPFPQGLGSGTLLGPAGSLFTGI